jgi:hypothetical protein
MLIELPDDITPGTKEAADFFQQSFEGYRFHSRHGTQELSRFVPFAYVKLPGDNVINVKSYLRF